MEFEIQNLSVSVDPGTNCYTSIFFFFFAAIAFSFTTVKRLIKIIGLRKRKQLRKNELKGHPGSLQPFPAIFLRFKKSILAQYFYGEYNEWLNPSTIFKWPDGISPDAKKVQTNALLC